MNVKCSETFRLRDIRHRHFAQSIKWTIMGAFIVPLMRGAVDDSLETDLPSAGSVTYKMKRQNVRRETSFCILARFLRDMAWVSPYVSLPTTAIMTSYVAGACTGRGLCTFRSSVLLFTYHPDAIAVNKGISVWMRWTRISQFIFTSACMAGTNGYGSVAVQRYLG